MLQKKKKKKEKKRGDLFTKRKTPVNDNVVTFIECDSVISIIGLLISIWFQNLSPKPG